MENLEELLVGLQWSNMRKKEDIHIINDKTKKGYNGVFSTTSVAHKNLLIHILLDFRINADNSACYQQSTHCWPL